MLNYSLEVFYSSTLFQIYSTTVLIMFCVNTLSFIFISYAIIFHGQLMEMYRWLLLSCFILSYFVDFTLTTGHIVPLLPAIVVYFDGIIGKNFNAKLMVSILLSTVAMKLLAISVVITYRSSMVTIGKMQEFFQKPKNLWATFMVHVILGCSPMIVLILDSEDPYIYIHREVPVLKEIPLGSNVTYIRREIKLYVVAGALAILIVVACAADWVRCYQMHHEIRKMKSQVTENVHRLQHMMYISALMEMAVTQLFITWPLFIVDLMIIFPIPYGSYFCCILFTTMSFQTTISTISQFYFIRPFKEAAKKLFFKFICLKNTSETITVISVQNTRNVNN